MTGSCPHALTAVSEGALRSGVFEQYDLPHRHLHLDYNISTDLHPHEGVRENIAFRMEAGNYQHWPWAVPAHPALDSRPAHGCITQLRENMVQEDSFFFGSV